jgi:catechol 2,3-dioxygenase-like lactoylglutathione lyase family enzyme
MSNEHNFVQVTPFLIVPDIETAVAFFRDLLGFSVWRTPGGDYAYVHRETVGFRLLLAGSGNEFVPGNRRFAHYIDVKDVDALYAELKPKLDLLPPGDVHGPADKGYGQRELLILAPDGNLIAFGHALFSRMVKEEPVIA